MENGLCSLQVVGVGAGVGAGACATQWKADVPPCTPSADAAACERERGSPSNNNNRYLSYRTHSVHVPVGRQSMVWSRASTVGCLRPAACKLSSPIQLQHYT